MVDISPEKDGGVLKEILKEGIGDEVPSAGNKVIVHYTGTLLDGTKFDSSKDRNEPLEFELKKNRVIKAWDIGVATMKRGEVAMLTCAPQYAYGEQGRPPKIPPNSTLKFEIEMIDWEGEDLSPDKDGSIVIYQINSNDVASFENPTDGSFVDIHITGKYNGQVFEDRDVQFDLGEGEDCGVIDGIEEALKSFSKNEKAHLKIKSKYAFKDKGNSKFNIPPNADVEYTVVLKSFEKAKENWNMDCKEKIEIAEKFKKKGTEYFKADKFSLAIKMYSRIISTLDFHPNSYVDEMLEERNKLLLSAHLNLALCYLKTNQNIKARESCDEALKLDSNNEKAYFRRGQANLALASPEIAFKDFNKVLDIQPKNNAATNQLLVCNRLIKKQRSKEKKLYATMFNKFAEEEKQKEQEEDNPEIMQEALGEWGEEERLGGRDATAFEKENPNILMLNANGTGEFQNM